MVSIRELAREDGAALATMLNDDAVLRADLDVRSGTPNTAEGVVRDVRKWCQSRRAVSYAILAGGVTVGMISLSHVDPESGTGRIGYWVGSRFRKKGYCSRAFDLVLQEARLRGVHTVSASVASTNMASRRVWEKAGGIGTPVSADRTRYEVHVGRQPGSVGNAAGPPA
jgi:[ribosomal protein S5]-alanine N-acetyltransferase